MWDGVERRSMSRFCESHIQMSDDVAVTKTTLIHLDKRINGSLLAIEKHINEGKGWRTTIAGLAIAIVLQIITFSYFCGQLTKQIEINTGKIRSLELSKTLQKIAPEKQEDSLNGYIDKIGI